MNTLEALKEAVNALNQIPNTKLNGKYRNTYELLSELGKVIRKEDKSLTK